MSPDPSVEPDTKDWTWVLARRCPECGLVSREVDLASVPVLLTGNAATFAAAVRGPGSATRPSWTVWSVLEYGCHVRDVHRVFDDRVRAMLAEDDPLFANWDQDVAAVEGRYDEQDPDLVAEELVAAAEQVAARYASLGETEWTRPGRRSNGSSFTVGSLARYHLHDVVHHAWDVT